MCLNNTSAKHGVWTVRVLYGRERKYVFKDRKQQLITASRFECFLVGASPQVYVLATIPHNARSPNHLPKMMDLFKDGTVWRMSDVAFVVNASAQYNGAPNKRVVLLDSPTRMVPVLSLSPDSLCLAQYISPAARLRDVLQVSQAVTMDVCLYVFACEVPRAQAIQGQDTSVATCIVAEDGLRAEVSCWGSSAGMMFGLIGQAVVVSGMSVSVTCNGVRLSLRDSSVIVTGPIAPLMAMAELMRTFAGVAPARTCLTSSSSAAFGGDDNQVATLCCAAIVEVLRCEPKAPSSWCCN